MDSIYIGGSFDVRMEMLSTYSDLFSKPVTANTIYIYTTVVSYPSLRISVSHCSTTHTRQ